MQLRRQLRRLHPRLSGIRCGLGQRRKPRALRQRKRIRHIRRSLSRAPARLPLVVHHLAQAPMLEHHPLPRLHPINPALKHAAHRNIRRIGAPIVHASIALRPQPHLDRRRPRPADRNAEVRRQNYIRIPPSRIIRLQRPPVQRHHQPRFVPTRCRACRRARIRRQAHLRRRAQAQFSTMRQRHHYRVLPSRHLAIRLDHRLPARHLQRSRHSRRRTRIPALIRHNRNRRKVRDLTRRRRRPEGKSGEKLRANQQGTSDSHPPTSPRNSESSVSHPQSAHSPGETAPPPQPATGAGAP